MTNGVDPSYERTTQVQWMVGDSGLVDTAQVVTAEIGIVPAGQMWLVERQALRYRPGLAPTTYVAFRLCANGTGPFDTRDATELRPAAGWTAGGRYDFAADESSPVRFFSGERVIATVPVFGDSTHKARMEVNVQVRSVEAIPGATQPDTEGIPAVAVGDDEDPHEPAWN